MSDQQQPTLAELPDGRHVLVYVNALRERVYMVVDMAGGLPVRCSAEFRRRRDTADAELREGAWPRSLMGTLRRRPFTVVASGEHAAPGAHPADDDNPEGGMGDLLRL